MRFSAAAVPTASWSCCGFAEAYAYAPCSVAGWCSACVLLSLRLGCLASRLCGSGSCKTCCRPARIRPHWQRSGCRWWPQLLLLRRPAVRRGVLMLLLMHCLGRGSWLPSGQLHQTCEVRACCSHTAGAAGTGSWRCCVPLAVSTAFVSHTKRLCLPAGIVERQLVLVHPSLQPSGQHGADAGASCMDACMLAGFCF